MQTCLAAVMPKPHAAIELRELPLPELEPDSALLRVELSEVCGTDVHLREGRLAGVPYPLIPGHVTVGRLERIRGKLSDVDGGLLREGDRVTFLDVHRTCHCCRACLIDKATTRCPNRKVYGITYGLADGLTGGWAEYLYLKPGTLCIPLGDASAESFMAGGCGLPTALHAVERANAPLGSTVLVLGAGSVGLSCIALSVLRGAGRVLCIGAPDLRLAAARALGAEETLNFERLSFEVRLEWVWERTAGRGADVTLEATGVPAAAVEAMRYTRDAGRAVVVGQYTDAGDATFNPHLDLNKKHLDVLGCWGSDYSHFHRAVELIKTPQGRRRWGMIKTETFALSGMNEALEKVKRGDVVKALVRPVALAV